LRPGASPHDIRTALLPEDRMVFDAAHERALASLDVTELPRTLEHWRRTAVIQSDPQDFRRVVRRVAESLTGDAIPADEPLAVTRAQAGM
jgi:uncharacterized protein DUF6247